MPIASFRSLVSASALLIALAAPAVEAETLRIATPVSPLTFDPHATNDFTTISVLRQVYDSLLSLGPNMEALPGLATSWEVIDDKTWRFHLREGVTFHDGSKMTAEDVAFSINRGKKSGFYASLFGQITEAKVAAPLTVDVVSSQPDPILPGKMVRMFILSETWAKTHGIEEIPKLSTDTDAYSRINENGTGPMTLKEHKADVQTDLAAFPDYWGERTGNVDRALYLPITSGPTRVAALLSGEVDVVTDVPLQDIDRLQSGGLEVATVPQFLWIQLEMDGTRDVALDAWDKAGKPLSDNPWKKVAVRQAVAHAIDAQAIVDRVMRGRARVLGQSSIPQINGYQPDLDDHWALDIERSKALLAEAGYPDGFVTQLNCPSERYVNIEDVCKAVASMLAKTGIEVRIKSMPWPEFAKMLVEGPNTSFHMIGVANVWDTQDAFLSIMMTRNKEAGEGFFNWALWSNPEFDAIAKELRRTFDPARREELYRAGLQLAKDRVNAVYLYQNQIVWAARSGLEGTMRSDAVLDLTGFSMK